MSFSQAAIPCQAKSQVTLSIGERAFVCVLTYFFKLYQIFFKSAFLVVCDITIFSKRYHDFFKINFTIFSNGFLNRYQWNKL